MELFSSPLSYDSMPYTMKGMGMTPIALLPIVSGATAGMAVIPLLAMLIQMYQRRSHLLREQERIKNTTFILSGTIGTDSLVGHIRSLCKLERQGVLHIITGRRKGYILFRDGKIIDGFYRNLVSLAGVKEMLVLTEGDYFFESRAVYQPNLVKLPVDDIIAEESTNENQREGKHHDG